MSLRSIDERCSGCRVCELVCGWRLFGENNPKKSALRVTGEFPAPGRYTVVTCDQCGECAEACPVGAIALGAAGAYHLDAELCTGCLACVEACPRGALFTHPDVAQPIKCILCGECIEFCPREALLDGSREEARS